MDAAIEDVKLFLDQTYISGMKLGVLIGSFFSAIMGYFILKFSVKNL